MPIMGDRKLFWNLEGIILKVGPSLCQVPEHVHHHCISFFCSAKRVEALESGLNWRLLLLFPYSHSLVTWACDVQYVATCDYWALEMTATSTAKLIWAVNAKYAPGFKDFFKNNTSSKSVYYFVQIEQLVKHLHIYCIQCMLRWYFWC